MARKKPVNRREKLQPPEIVGFEDVFRTGLSESQVEFLFCYIQHGSLVKAATHSGNDRSRHYEWMRKTLYAESFAAARKYTLGALEDEAHRRAVDGVDEPVYQNGVLVGMRRRFSDSLLVKLLEANGPEKYGKLPDPDAEGGHVNQIIFYDPAKGDRPSPEDMPPADANVFLPVNGRGRAPVECGTRRSATNPRKTTQTVKLPIKRPRPEDEESQLEGTP